MKDILIYFPDTIFPLSMGNRVRVIEKVKALSKNNSVTFLSIVENDKQKEETNRILGSYCRCEFVFRPGKKSLYGVFLRSKWKMFDYLGILPHDYIITNGVDKVSPNKLSLMVLSGKEREPVFIFLFMILMAINGKILLWLVKTDCLFFITKEDNL